MKTVAAAEATRRRTHMERRTALITGASGGIGLDLARLFARDGWNLVLTARTEARLGEVAEELRHAGSRRVDVVACDLSLPGAADALWAEVGARGVETDALVNNAGFGDRRPFTAQTAETQMGMVRLNVEALTVLTRLALPGMLARGWGRVLNVASTAAFQPGPHMAVYYATKAYVLSLSEALHEELRGTGVSSTALCPGPTRTGFADRAGMGSSILFRMSMDSASVAAAGYRGMMRGDAQVIPGWRNWIGAQAVRVTPRALVRRVVCRLQGTR